MKLVPDDHDAFLTLEIIPVIYTYWRNEQLLWTKLERVSGRLLRTLRIAAAVIKSAGFLAAGALVARLYLVAPPRAVMAVPIVAGVLGVAALLVYVFSRREARRLVAPADALMLTSRTRDGS